MQIDLESWIYRWLYTRRKDKIASPFSRARDRVKEKKNSLLLSPSPWRKESTWPVIKRFCTVLLRAVNAMKICWVGVTRWPGGEGANSCESERRRWWCWIGSFILFLLLFDDWSVLRISLQDRPGSGNPLRWMNFTREKRRSFFINSVFILFDISFNIFAKYFEHWLCFVRLIIVLCFNVIRCNWIEKKIK